MTPLPPPPGCPECDRGSTHKKLACRQFQLYEAGEQFRALSPRQRSQLFERAAERHGHGFASLSAIVREQLAVGAWLATAEPP